MEHISNRHCHSLKQEASAEQQTFTNWLASIWLHYCDCPYGWSRFAYPSESRDHPGQQLDSSPRYLDRGIIRQEVVAGSLCLSQELENYIKTIARVTAVWEAHLPFTKTLLVKVFLHCLSSEVLFRSPLCVTFCKWRVFARFWVRRCADKFSWFGGEEIKASFLSILACMPGNWIQSLLQLKTAWQKGLYKNLVGDAELNTAVTDLYQWWEARNNAIFAN